MFKFIERTCAVCGKKMKIQLFKNRSYENGFYFGEMKIPFGRGKYKEISSARENKTGFDIVEWTGKKKDIEYWECDNCYKES